MNLIETKDLTKNYKDIVALDYINLEIKEGEIFGLLGVNGAGKTTLIKILTTLTKPSSGQAFIDGYDIKKDGQEIKAIIGVCPQETAIATNLTVRENLELMAGIHGFSKEKINDKTNKLIKDFGLEKVKNKKSANLSGGYQRRLSIAMAIIGEPKILFLDEPSLGIDVIARSELWEIIKELKENLTIILTTHYMEEAEYLSDRLAILRDGKILTVGTASEIKNLSDTDNFVDAFIKITKEGK